MMIHLKLIKIIALSMCTNRTTAQSSYIFSWNEIQQKLVPLSLSFFLFYTFFSKIKYIKRKTLQLIGVCLMQR